MAGNHLVEGLHLLANLFTVERVLLLLILLCVAYPVVVDATPRLRRRLFLSGRIKRLKRGARRVVNLFRKPKQ